MSSFPCATRHDYPRGSGTKPGNGRGSGGTGSITVNASGTACVWTVDSPALWITGVTPTNGAGNAVVTYLVATNTVESPRSASITIAGLTQIIDQAAALGPFPQWQLNYFGCTNCAQAAPDFDADGDGQSNWAEFLGGFNPTNAASYLHVTSVAREGADLRVYWLTAGGHTNSVEFTGDLGLSYSNLSGQVIIPGIGETTTNHLDSGAATNSPTRYYRIRLEP